jgi:uncharacterized protein YcbK (DUF882 family)
MGDLTKNISRHELACRCGCGLDSMDVKTIEVVQECCDHFADILCVDRVVLNINSAARCFEYNRKPISLGGPGSTDGSQHPRCRAMDFSISNVSPIDVYAYLVTRYPDRYGFGKYSTFSHADTRSNGPARWG